MIRPPADASFSLGVIILGAGRSTRMGRPKLLLPWGPTSILGHVIGQWRAQAASQVTVVCAADDSVVHRELDRLAFPREHLIENPAPDRGMFSSILCGARWPGWTPSLTHWAIVLGDQPHLQTQTLARLLECTRTHPQQVCQPTRHGKRGHPAVVPKTVFVELSQSTSVDLNAFLLGRPRCECPCDDPGHDLDIDRPEDYQEALSLVGLSPPP